MGEEEINSELELMTSQMFFAKLLSTNNLDKKHFLSSILHPVADAGEPHGQGGCRSPVRPRDRSAEKTNIISVTYESKDPGVAQRVLQTLDDAYLQKHLEVHHPGGQYEFFEQQADKYKQDMLAAEAQLKQFSDQSGGVAPTVMRDMTLQKLADFNSSLETTRPPSQNRSAASATSKTAAESRRRG